ncbi:MAG: portal protein [bacterium]|nr:portal protein [bacterium]
MTWRTIAQMLSGGLLRLRAAYAAHLHAKLARIYAAAGILSVALLILEFGFHNPGEMLPGRAIILPALIYFLFGYEVLSLIFTPGAQNFRSYLRAHIIQAVVVALVLALLLFQDAILAWLAAAGFGAGDDSAEASTRAMFLFLAVGQCLLLIGSLAHLLRQPAFMGARALNPSLIFVGSFALVIGVGFALLSLPRMQLVDVAWVDVLFITVSAVCVTGLASVTITESFTPGGLALIMILIQIGGLGLMTLTSFLAIFLTGRASVSTKVLLRDLLSDEGIGRVKTIVRNIAILTFGVEAAGAVFLYFSMPQQLYANHAEHIFAAVFHAVSAFCNAGFSLHPDSLAGLDRTLPGRLYVGGHMVLILVGGLGFPVIVQLYEYAKRRRLRRPLNATTRLVLIVNAILLVSATCAYLWLERGDTLADFDALDRLWHSVFFAVTMRTAGFNTLTTAEMGLSMTFLAFLFMWIGASPLSTGGGIKTTTAGIAFLHILAQVTGKNRVELHRKTISPQSVSRAFATIVLSLFVIFSGIFLLLSFEDFAFVDIAFETVSAFGTVGLSRGITGELSSAGKLVLCLVMLCGRVGALTFLIALTPRVEPPAYTYPSEYVVVG